MRNLFGLIPYTLVCFVFVISVGPLYAEDGPTLYKMLCSACHDGAIERAPNRDALRGMSPDRVLSALENGPMLSMASGRSSAERRALAEFVSGKSLDTAVSTTPSPETMCRPGAGEFTNPFAQPAWNGWGANTSNTRYQDAKTGGLSAADVPRLKLKWAFGFPGELSSDAQPTIVGGRVLVGTQSGVVYSLNAATGCVHWFFKAEAAVRAAVTVARIQTTSGPKFAAFVGDRSANVYALDAGTGQLLWKKEVDDFSVARVTGSPVFHDGRLYVGVASGEENNGAVPTYECCRFRGSLVALNAVTGEQIWKTYTIPEAARPTKKNKVGTQMWGPSGVPIWSSPAIDVQRNVVYATTGNNYSEPTTANADAFMAFDLQTGKILWTRQVTPSDAWNTACRLAEKINCESNGEDFDFASPPILVSLSNGRRALVAGQKSGIVYAVDPDRRGEILWQTRVGKGGINGGVQWGSAADAANIYVAVSDLDRFAIPNSQATEPDPNVGGGMFALKLNDGQRVWATPPPPCGDRKRCSPAQSAAVSAISGVAFSGSVDGHLRAYSAVNGTVIWDFDTARAYETINGVTARGGSMNVGGPAIGGGTIFVNSGYVQNGIPGNVLLAFSVDGK
jgi:polyvinyl alcohol dehydrogenase (cytochrome)